MLKYGGQWERIMRLGSVRTWDSHWTSLCGCPSGKDTAVGYQNQNAEFLVCQDTTLKLIWLLKSHTQHRKKQTATLIEHEIIAAPFTVPSKPVNSNCHNISLIGRKGKHIYLLNLSTMPNPSDNIYYFLILKHKNSGKKKKKQMSWRVRGSLLCCDGNPEQSAWIQRQENNV